MVSVALFKNAQSDEVCLSFDCPAGAQVTEIASGDVVETDGHWKDPTRNWVRLGCDVFEIGYQRSLP
jgi:hypothetical protein